MSVFLDPTHYTIRMGDEATEFGKPWTGVAQMVVQYDRRVYIYAITGTKTTRTEMLEIIRAVREEAKRWGWTEIIWTRERADGTTHVAYIPIKGKGPRE